MADPASGADTFSGRRQEIEGLREAIAEVERNWGHRARLPEEARRLEEALITRRMAAASLQFRLEAARRTVDDLAGQMRAVDDEIAGLERGLWAVLSRTLEVVTGWGEPTWSPIPVLGYRLWVVGSGGIQGATHFVWDRPTLTAVCARSAVGDDGDVPHTDGRCGHPPCGIYALKDPATVLRFGLPGTPGDIPMVMGLVALSGKVVEHEAGYRGQHAAVVAAALLHPGRMLASADPEWLERLFVSPSVVAVEPNPGWVSGPGIYEALIGFFGECASKEEQKWT
jgi:hypothetical protein